MKKPLSMVVAALALLAGVFWMAFGSLSPCEALRGEVRRAGEAKAGLLGKAFAGAFADLKTDGYTPVQCLGKAVRLKLGADVTDVLKD